MFGFGSNKSKSSNLSSKGKSWIINFLTERNLREPKGRIIKVCRHICGPKHDGSVVKQVTDHSVFINAIFTKSAIDGYQTDEELCTPPEWDQAVLIIKKYHLEFTPHLQKSDCEFLLVIEKFSLLDVHDGFDSKHRIHDCMEDPRVLQGVHERWTQWMKQRNQQDTSEDSMAMESGHLSQLLAEIGQPDTQTQTEEDTGNVGHEDVPETSGTHSSISTTRHGCEMSMKGTWEQAKQIPFAHDFIVPHGQQMILDSIKEWQNDFRPPASEESKSSSESSHPQFSDPTLTESPVGKGKGKSSKIRKGLAKGEGTAVQLPGNSPVQDKVQEKCGKNGQSPITTRSMKKQVPPESASPGTGIASESTRTESVAREDDIAEVGNRPTNTIKKGQAERGRKRTGDTQGVSCNKQELKSGRTSSASEDKGHEQAADTSNNKLKPRSSGNLNIIEVVTLSSLPTNWHTTNEDSLELTCPSPPDSQESQNSQNKEDDLSCVDLGHRDVSSLRSAAQTKISTPVAGTRSSLGSLFYKDLDESCIRRPSSELSMKMAEDKKISTNDSNNNMSTFNIDPTGSNKNTKRCSSDSESGLNKAPRTGRIVSFAGVDEMKSPQDQSRYRLHSTGTSVYEDAASHISVPAAELVEYPQTQPFVPSSQGELSGLSEQGDDESVLPKDNVHEKSAANNSQEVSFHQSTQSGGQPPRKPDFLISPIKGAPQKPSSQNPQPHDTSEGHAQDYSYRSCCTSKILESDLMEEERLKRLSSVGAEIKNSGSKVRASSTDALVEHPSFLESGSEEQMPLSLEAQGVGKAKKDETSLAKSSDVSRRSTADKGGGVNATTEGRTEEERSLELREPGSGKSGRTGHFSESEVIMIEEYSSEASELEAEYDDKKTSAKQSKDQAKVLEEDFQINTQNAEEVVMVALADNDDSSLKFDENYQEKSPDTDFDSRDLSLVLDEDKDELIGGISEEKLKAGHTESVAGKRNKLNKQKEYADVSNDDESGESKSTRSNTKSSFKQRKNPRDKSEKLLHLTKTVDGTGEKRMAEIDEPQPSTSKAADSLSQFVTTRRTRSAKQAPEVYSANKLGEVLESLPSVRKRSKPLSSMNNLAVNSVAPLAYASTSANVHVIEEDPDEDASAPESKTQKLSKEKVNKLFEKLSKRLTRSCAKTGSGKETETSQSEGVKRRVGDTSKPETTDVKERKKTSKIPDRIGPGGDGPANCDISTTSKDTSRVQRQEFDSTRRESCLRLSSYSEDDIRPAVQSLLEFLDIQPAENKCLTDFKLTPDMWRRVHKVYEKPISFPEQE